MKVTLVAAITFSIWSTTAVAGSCPQTAEQAERLVERLPLVASIPEKPEFEEALVIGYPGENTYNSSSVKVLGAQSTKVISTIYMGKLLSLTFHLPGKDGDYVAAFRSAHPEAGSSLRLFRSDERRADGDLEGAHVKTWLGQTQLVCQYVVDRRA